jgi:hypothetical protein
MRWGKSVYVAVMLLVFPFCVNAADTGAQSLFLMLDSGFVGRPVDLSLYDGGIHLAWNERALAEPTDVTVSWDGTTLRIALGNAAGFTEGSTIDVTILGSRGQVAPESEFTLTSADLAPIPLVAGVSTYASEVIVTDETMTLTLDSGFVGRPVSLGVFGGAFTLAWDENALIAPTTLRLTRTHGGMMEDQTEASPGVSVEFGDPKAMNASGSFRLVFKADRPPAASEQTEVNVYDAGESTAAAAFAGESISLSLPARASAVFAPAYREGIMRQGIASWYSYKECLCAASPDVPKGTRMKVSRADDASRFTVVTINDWGPDRSVHPDRVIDLDRVAFERIGNPRGGLLAVTVAVLDPEDPLYALGDELPPPPWRW